MKTVQLIRNLSDQGAEDFQDSLGWINPLPKEANELIEKIDIARSRLAYKQDRQGSSDKDDTTSERAILSRLKVEIEALLSAS